MVKGPDQVSLIIKRVIDDSIEPLETKEIQEAVQKNSKKSTRTIVMHRLNMLRGDRKIMGKFIGPGKGVWIWWKIHLLTKEDIKTK